MDLPALCGHALELNPDIPGLRERLRQQEP
jgi:hypothetical protein